VPVLELVDAVGVARGLGVVADEYDRHLLFAAEFAQQPEYFFPALGVQ
jgi:hypothetical protein